MTLSAPSARIGYGHPKALSAWYPNLPGGWNIGRVKSIARRVTDGAHISPDTDGGVYDFVSTRDLSDGQIDFSNSLKTTPETYQYMVRTGCQPWDGDVLFSKDGTVGSTALVIGNHEFVIASSLVIITPDQRRMDSRFLQFIFASKSTKEQSAVMMRGAGLPRLSVGNLARIEIPVPPHDEQRRIADFLDHETVQIDALIAKQEQLIEILRERRVAVAEVALTDLTWNVPLGAATSLIQTGPFGSQISSSEYIPGGVPVINPSHIVNGLIVPDPNVAVSEQKALELARHALREGDLVAARRGELGRCAVVDSEIARALCGTGSVLIRSRHEHILPRFLALVFSSRRTRESLSLQSVGSTMDNLNASIISSLRVPVPEVLMQAEILDHTDRQVAKIDALIAKAEEFISLARERRAALIAEAVTGRIDVSTGKAREGA